MQKPLALLMLTTLLLLFAGCGSDDDTTSVASSSSSSAMQSSTASSIVSSPSASSISSYSSAASMSSSSSSPALIERLTQFAEREHGYHNFDTMVIDSDTAHNAFLDSLLPQSSWNDKEAFFDAMNTLQIDYAEENLLLFRHTETSGSNVVTLGEPQIDNTGAIIDVDRFVPEFGTDDMAYYLYVYRVAKTIPQVTFIVNGTPAIIPNHKPAACTEQYQPVCADLEIVCITTPCDPIPTTYDNLCFMQNDPMALYRYDGVCDANATMRSVIDPSAIVQGTEQFGHAMMAAYLDPSENLFLSSFSISAALAMTYGGMYGTSAEEFETLFQFDKNLSVHNAFAALLPQLVPEYNAFSVANSLWPQQDYPFYPAFLSTVTKKYGAAVFAMDYPNDPTANETINAWVEEKTEEKIKDLIPSPLSGSTVMVLVNAIYFKGNWALEFDVNDTKTEPFYLADSSTVNAEIMHMQTDFNYTENSLFQAIELAYAEREFSMVAFLPKAEHTLREIQSHLESNSLEKVIDAMYPGEVKLSLPKFKIKWGTKDLTQTLNDLGLVSPFSGVADFRLIADVGIGELLISKVLHQTFVEVNEKGTEAAAATAVVIETSGMPMEPPAFRADRPFLFYIRDNRTGMLLFSGLLADPTQE